MRILFVWSNYDTQQWIRFNIFKKNLSLTNMQIHRGDSEINLSTVYVLPGGQLHSPTTSRLVLLCDA
jgi:hypothetical protein